MMPFLTNETPATPPGYALIPCDEPQPGQRPENLARHLRATEDAPAQTGSGNPWVDAHY